MNTRRASVLALALTLSFFAAGCRKKVGVPPPPAVAAAPVAPKPVVQKPMIAFFTAEPSTIERGQASVLKWDVKGADSVSINQGLGTVSASGNRSVFPSSTTSYTLTATNAGGSSTESVTVNVTAPAAVAPPVTPAPSDDFGTMVSKLIQDIYFDYDKNEIREDSRAILTKNADALKTIFGKFPNNTLTIEGHCDERGSAEYNLGLGDRRATATKEFLTQLGVSADRLRTISYGKERPTCTEGNESCWSKNRRSHFVAQ